MRPKKKAQVKKHNMLTLACPTCKGAGCFSPKKGAAPEPCTQPWCHKGRSLLPFENISEVAFGGIPKEAQEHYWSDVRNRYWPNWERPPFAKTVTHVR